MTIATNMAGRGTDIKLGGNAEMRVAQEVDPSWPEDKQNKAIEAIYAEVERDKEVVLKAGGLYVIGTERHESRRIDNQLRGRSGRQGDPGASMFFLSVEDDLMRIFAGDRLEALLNNKNIGLAEGEALEHPLISKMLERAQGKVEAMHFDVRKSILKFDNVMNDQRKIIYEQRREIMESSDLGELIKDMRAQVIEDTVALHIPPGAYAEQWETEGLKTEVLRLTGLDLPVPDWAKEEGIADEEILQRIMDAADTKMAEKAVRYSPDVWRRVEKSIVLQLLDQSWKEHLLALDHLRQGINLRAFGQKDPLNEYKAEAFAMFELMLDKLRELVTQTLSFVEINPESGRLSMTAESQETHETRQDPAMENAPQQQQASNVQPMPVRKRAPSGFDKNDPDTWGKIQRNSDCPCGSGKKYKHCHGDIGKAAMR